MAKEVAVKNSNELKVHTTSGLMGVAANIERSDIQVPSLILMQANSSFVQESDTLSAGDFVHSITHDVWGKKDKEKVELVFFDMFKTLIVSDVTKDKQWLETKAWEPKFETMAYEEVVGDATIRNEKCFNYAVFRKSDLREVTKPDGSTGYVASPIIIKFKGGSLKNGKRLNQMFQDYAAFGSPSWATSFFLKANLEEKDNKKYWAYDFERGAQTEKSEQFAAELLCQQMNDAKASGGINVVDAEETTTGVKNYADDVVYNRERDGEIC